MINSQKQNLYVSIHTSMVVVYEVWLLEITGFSFNKINALILEFEGAEETVYFLASGQAEASAWIKALKDASYTHLKQKYQDLQKEARRLQAQVWLKYFLCFGCIDLLPHQIFDYVI